jgi:hypothetical protein
VTDIIAASYGPRHEVVLAIYADAVEDRWFKVYGEKPYRHVKLAPGETGEGTISAIAAYMDGDINNLGKAVEMWRAKR